jgi:hypothetical protein
LTGPPSIAAGALRPGRPAPNGAELARATGYAQPTCRRALRSLLKDGILVPGPSPNARFRVAGRPLDPGDALSTALAPRRHDAGLTQPELAALVGRSVTTVGHAETGRLWQSRHFWENTDKALSATVNCSAPTTPTAPASRRTPTPVPTPRETPL